MVFGDVNELDIFGCPVAPIDDRIQPVTPPVITPMACLVALVLEFRKVNPKYSLFVYYILVNESQQD